MFWPIQHGMHMTRVGMFISLLAEGMQINVRHDCMHRTRAGIPAMHSSTLQRKACAIFPGSMVPSPG